MCRLSSIWPCSSVVALHTLAFILVLLRAAVESFVFRARWAALLSPFRRLNASSHSVFILCMSSLKTNTRLDLMTEALSLCSRANQSMTRSYLKVSFSMEWTHLSDLSHSQFVCIAPQALGLGDQKVVIVVVLIVLRMVATRLARKIVMRGLQRAGRICLLLMLRSQVGCCRSNVTVRPLTYRPCRVGLASPSARRRKAGAGLRARGAPPTISPPDSRSCRSRSGGLSAGRQPRRLCLPELLGSRIYFLVSAGPLPRGRVRRSDHCQQLGGGNDEDHQKNWV